MPENPSARLPLMPSQLGMRDGHLQDPGNPAFSEALIGWYSGEGLSLELLVEATERGLRECEALLMRAGVDPDGSWYQERRPDAEIPTRVVDLSAEPDPVDAARRYARREVRTPVRICGPELPFRNFVLDLGQGSFAWFVVCHHMFLDGYGADLMRHRTGAILTALVAGVDVPGPVPGGIADLIAELTAASPGADPAGLDFWKTHLRGAPEVISLADRVLPPAPLHAMTVLHIPGFATRVTEASGGANWAHIAAAAAISYLSTCLEQQAVVVGVPVTGRTTARERSTPSQSMTTLPLHLRVDHSAGVTDLAGVFRETLRATKPYQRQDFRALRAELPVAFRTGRVYGPTVNVVPFEVSTPNSPFEKSAEVVSQGPVEDVAIAVAPGPDGGIQVKLLFNPDLYPAPVRDGHAERLDRWMRQVGEAPCTAVADLVCLTAAEEAAHARLAATPAVGAHRPLTWGSPCTVADLAAAAGATGVTGICVASALGRPALFGRPGRVTLRCGHGDVRTGLLAAPGPEGLVYRGVADERVVVNGTWVELEGVRRAVAEAGARPGAEVTASARRLSIRMPREPGPAEREAVAQRVAEVTAAPFVVRGPRPA